MAKENPPEKEPQVAFDLGDEPSDPPPAEEKSAKKAQPNAARATGKLVKNRAGGGDAVGKRVKELQAANPPVSKPEATTKSAPPNSDPLKSAAPKPQASNIPETKAETTTPPVAKDAPTISIADEVGPPKSPPEKIATPSSERTLAAEAPEPAAGNGAEPVGHPPVEIPGEEMEGEEMEGEEMEGEEMEGEEMEGEEMEGEEMEGEEMEGEEMEGEEMEGEETERMIQLINNQEGCWKVLPDGERVALSDQEWRSELARHFRRETPAGG